MTFSKLILFVFSHISNTIWVGNIQYFVSILMANCSLTNCFDHFKGIGIEVRKFLFALPATERFSTKIMLDNAKYKEN